MDDLDSEDRPHGMGLHTIGTHFIRPVIPDTMKKAANKKTDSKPISHPHPVRTPAGKPTKRGNNVNRKIQDGTGPRKK